MASKRVWASVCKILPVTSPVAHSAGGTAAFKPLAMNTIFIIPARRGCPSPQRLQASWRQVDFEVVADRRAGMSVDAGDAHGLMNSFSWSLLEILQPWGALELFK